MAHGPYYDETSKEVFAGDTAKAADLNAINIAVDSGFSQVADDLDTLEASVSTGAEDSEAWATDRQICSPLFPEEL